MYEGVFFKINVFHVAANTSNYRTDISINLCIISIHMLAVVNVFFDTKYSADYDEYRQYDGDYYILLFLFSCHWSLS
ncbi:hypothetical protein D3C86_1436280 [compost metagenome]